MKLPSRALIKFLALLLTFTSLLTVLASCASGYDGDLLFSQDYSISDSVNATTAGSITIFKNGIYPAKIVHDGSDMGKAICEKLTKIISDFTGIPLVSEDSYAQYAGEAILVGETTYAESINAYSTLGNDSAIATLIGNKYVIAFSSQEQAEKLLESFNNNLSTKATKLEITINSSWQITIGAATNTNNNTNNNTTNNNTTNNNTTNDQTDEVITEAKPFDESDLKDSATLPSLGTSYNSGQSSKTYIMKSADKAKFTSLCSQFKTNGFKEYTTNTIGTNLFATYVTKTQIAHVMFFPNKSQIRTAVDKRGTGMNGFSLTGIKSENAYKKTTDSKMIFCDISNADWPGGMCLIFKLADGRFFIIDAGIGGYLADGRSSKGSSSGWIYATLAKFADNPKNIQVAAWMITHVHSDHAGGLYDMALGYYGYEGKKHTVMPKEMKQYIKIDKIIYNAPDSFPDCDREGWMKTIINGFGVKTVVKAHPGQVFYIADLTMTIYGSLDLMIENAGSSKDLNDFSLVSRVEFNNKSLLVLGDSDTIPNPVIAAIYKTSLKSDILQLSHHGYGDVGDHDVNSYCNPTMTLWAVSKKDQRTDYNTNVNTSILSSTNSNFTGIVTNSSGKSYGKLTTGKSYRPGMGNLVFDSNWNTSTISRTEMLNAIPKCDGTYCKSSSCSKKSSSNTYAE